MNRASSMRLPERPLGRGTTQHDPLIGMTVHAQRQMSANLLRGNSTAPPARIELLCPWHCRQP